MRRPRLHRPIPAIEAWARPYTGVASMAVFYNGDPNTPPAPVPAPAPAPAPVDPPKPGPPTQRTFTQEEVEALAAKEKAQGKRSAAKEFAEKHGFTTIEDAEAFIAAARQAQEAALSEQEKQAREFAEKQRKFEADQAAFAASQRALNLEKALTRLGALDLTDDQGNEVPNLQDAMALLERELREAPDADEAAITEAAGRIKKRRPEFFGSPAATPAPQTLPPAPSGAPAGGPPRTPAAGKDAIKTAARERAARMGLRNDDAA